MNAFEIMLRLLDNDNELEDLLTEYEMKYEDFVTSLYNNIPEFSVVLRNVSIENALSMDTNVYICEADAKSDEFHRYMMFPSMFLFHGTPVYNICSILKHGIQPSHHGNGVWLTSDVATALSYSSSDSNTYDAKLSLMAGK